MTTLQDIGLLVLAVVAIIGTVVVSAVGHTVPSELWTIDTVLVGAVAGTTVPKAVRATVPPT